MKYIAIPFIHTMKSVDYKEVVTQEFDLEFLYSKNKKHNNTLFYGWTGMEMAGRWYKLENFEDKLTLEFYDTYYHIQKKKNQQIKYCFPYPRTINDFMIDCSRCDADLWWNENALIKYTPKILMTEEDIDAYYKEILIKIGKD